jgi:Ca2+-binding RTX toxin-like protein
VDGLRLDYSDGSNDFHVIYSASTFSIYDFQLQTGNYPGAYLYGSAAPGDPDRASMDVHGNGRSVSSTVGIFTIYDIAIDSSGPTPTLTTLRSDFLFQPDEGPIRALNGKLNYAYNEPLIADIIVENPNEGLDTVRSSATYSLPANVENLTLTGTAAIHGTGNVLNNVLEGNSAGNTLSGGSGNDTINAGGGNDALIGGAGVDTLTGGTGSDRFDYNVITEGLDTIADFTRGAGGDVLDISDVLAGYVPGTSNINNFVQLTGGASTTVSVNADGVGMDFVGLATLQTVAMTASLLNEMMASGNLVAA